MISLYLIKVKLLKMKKKIFYGVLIGLLMTACAQNTSNDEMASEENTEAAMTEEASGEGAAENAMMEEDLVASIVKKGGAKAQDQVLIETMMNDLSEEAESEQEKQLLGHWVGKFGKNMINLTLTNIDGNKVEGFSVCAGNFRKITGTMDAASGAPVFSMNEPGTDEYDGTFKFTYDAAGKKMKGNWTPFKAKGNSEKDYVLEKRTFHYDPNVGTYPQASNKVLSDDFLMEFDQWTLGLIRNEIYARHGYSFKNKDWRYEFEGKDWYMPMGVDIRHMLSDIEIKNIGLIYEYESYFDEYYDEYGR